MFWNLGMVGTDTAKSLDWCWLSNCNCSTALAKFLALLSS